MARPTKLSEAVITKLAEAIGKGATYALACKYAGIGVATLTRWQQAAVRAPTDSLARQLVERLDDAEGAACVKWLRLIEDAAEGGTWQAAAWLLERRHPHDYGRQVVQHQVEMGDGLSGLLKAFGGTNADTD